MIKMSASTLLTLIYLALEFFSYNIKLTKKKDRKGYM